MLSDLQLVQQIKGGSATRGYGQIFGSALDGQNLVQFFTNRVRSVDVSDCGGGKSVAACVQPYIDPHIMWLTNNYVTWQIPQIYRISVVFHESRHTESENGNWSHVNCPIPFRDAQGKDIRGIISGTLLQGLPACDTTPLGAYGLQAELLKNVEYFCANCTEKMKMDGKLFGDDTVNRISNPVAREQLGSDVQVGK